MVCLSYLSETFAKKMVSKEDHQKVFLHSSWKMKKWMCMPFLSYFDTIE